MRIKIHVMFRPVSILLITSIVTRTTSFRAAPCVFLSLTSSPTINQYSTIAKVAHQTSHQTLRAKVASREVEPTDALTCKLCQRSFTSRNAIFRHLRGEGIDGSECYLRAAELGMQGGKAVEKEILMSAVIRYGYLVKNKNDIASQVDTSRDIQYRVGVSDIVANTIHSAFLNLTSAYFQDELTFELSTSALSWSTAAKLRQPSLRQDDEVMGAVSEMLSFNYRAVVPQTSNIWNEFVEHKLLLHDLQSVLNSREGSDDIQIVLHAIDPMLPRSTKFYAERGCTQRSYRFLLPIRWLNFDSGTNLDNVHLIEWVKGITATSLSERKHQPRGDAARSPPDCIMKLKQALKAAESKTVPNRKTRRKNASIESNKSNDDGEPLIDGTSDIMATNVGPIRLSPGRFGQLWRKERRCWSNFCHPELRGMASSPSHDATWRTLDKASIVDIVNVTQVQDRSDTDELCNVHVVLEFRADGFLLGVLPRIISSIVAIANEWIPTKFFEVAISPDFYIEAPPSPPFAGRMMYFYSPRYHFHELTTANDDSSSSGTHIFNSCINGGSVEYQWEKEIRSALIYQLSTINIEDERSWLARLRDEISVNIKRDMQPTSETVPALVDEGTNLDGKGNVIIDLQTPCPEGAYSDTLGLLRDIVSRQQWPSTSMARSRVIKSTCTPGATNSVLTTKKNAVGSTFPGDNQSSGSFTVVNMNALKESNSIPIPAANSRFPDLAKAVFDLERAIILSQNPIPAADGMTKGRNVQRQPSTHCAVNRNAQFTPHVDSGRGLGQSVSMIVGLGDYNGGEVIVEGKPYAIRYNALEFDGWRQLHWTAPFVGERFSLVWFTPDVQGDQGTKSDGSTMEDNHASNLVKLHNMKTPFLRPLVYRTNSTDSLVIGEIFGSYKGCAYTLESNPNLPDGFSVKGHTVLDIGAHIGVFSRYALQEGCTRVIAYEPEPSNYDLLIRNLQPISENSKLTIELHRAAVSAVSETRTLVKARDENDGKQNTWRHSFSEYSQYVDKSAKLPHESQKAILDRVKVQSVSFFEEAMVPGVTFVKLDCEGAEIEILLSSEASARASWLDVTHLVVEWSFTKERRVDVFHAMLKNLRSAGFDVSYEGKGSWWDVGSKVMWPYPNDLVVFARMR